MSANVDTMAYRDELPWHGLGEKVDDKIRVQDMVKKARINWKVERSPLQLADGREVPGFFALERSDNGKVLDVVGSKYVVTQNVEGMEFFTEFVEAGDAKMETMGALREGRQVWGLANLNTSFKLKNNDEVKNYLLLVLPHEHGKSIIVKYTNVRVVCSNTMAMALRNAKGEFRMGHRRVFDHDQIALAKTTLGIAREQASEFEANAKALQKKTGISEVDALAFYNQLLKIEDPVKVVEEVTLPRVKLLLDVNRRAPGAQPNNAWGLFNSITYYADHLASRTPDKRLSNAWLGKTSRMKEDALKILLDA